MIDAIMTALWGIALAIYRFIVVLCSEVVNWFQERTALVMSDRDNLAFTIQEHMENGDVNYVQGIFNQREEEIVDARKINGQDADLGMRQAHRGTGLAIYE